MIALGQRFIQVGIRKKVSSSNKQKIQIVKKTSNFHSNKRCFQKHHSIGKMLRVIMDLKCHFNFKLQETQIYKIKKIFLTNQC